MALLGDIYEIRPSAFAKGQVGEMVLHYRCDAPAGGAGPTDIEIADFFHTLLKADIAALIANTATMVCTFAQKVGPAIRTLLARSTGATAVGTAGIALAPTQVAGVITKQTLLAGKRYRGRSYVPFPATADVNTTTGSPTASYVTRLTTLAGHLVPNQTVPGAGGGSVVMHPIVLHKLTMTGTDIVAAVPRPYFGTQRRRGDLGRPNPSP